MDTKEFRVLIKHCTIIDWYAEFERVPTSTDDVERSDRTKSTIVPENITKVHKMVLGDHKLKFCEIADTLQISERSVFTMWHKSLEMRKLFSKWVPRLLTPDQKQQHVEDSKLCLKLFKRGKRIFCNGMWQWMEHGSTTTHLKQKDRQLSGQQLVKAIQSDQKLNTRLTRLWHPYFGTRMVFSLLTTLRKVKPLTATITWHYWID